MNCNDDETMIGRQLQVSAQRPEPSGKIIYTAPLKTSYHDNTTGMKTPDGTFHWLTAGERIALLPPGTEQPSPANVCPICGGTFYCAPDEFETHKNICRHKAYALEVLKKAKIEEPPTCDPRPEPTGKRFTYLAIDVETCFAFCGVKPEGSYLSEDEQGKLLRIALKEGYRWTQTFNDKAIWEKEWGV